MGTGQQSAKAAGDTYQVRSEFYAPPAQFDGCFTTFYHMSLQVYDGRTVHDLLQPEWANLRFFAQGSPSARIGRHSVENARFYVTGPSSLPCLFEVGSSEMWGIGLLPLGWARLIDADAQKLANGLWDGTQHPAFAKFAFMQEALCDPDSTREEQFDAIVAAMEQMMQPCRDEAKIVRVHQAIVEGSYPVVADMADACGMSIRTLERVCARYFGFTPKKLMRRQRFTRSLATFMLHKGSRWTEAMDADYHDQAQFTREFNEFMTMNPSEYAAMDHPIFKSFVEARARIWGSAAQALDKPSR